MFDAVLRDFFEGIGMGCALFLMALPVAGIVRWQCKVPSAWARFLLAFVLFCVAYGVLRTFVHNDLMGLANIVLVPSLLYLPCAWAVSAKGAWLWRGFGMLTLPLVFAAAMIAAVLVRAG
jgi:hypothetical protein